MTATTAYARTEYRAPGTDKGGIIDHEGRAYFGRWEGGDFVCRPFNSGRNYKTTAGAVRAISRWVAS
jgi:hypothetical protein